MPMSPRSGLRLAALVVGGVGVALAFAGTLVVRYSPGAIAARHARMSALPAPSVVGLTDLPAGREVLIDGRIGDTQPKLFRDFVAFVKEDEETDPRDRDRTHWVTKERQVPPLAIVVTDDDVVRIVNRDYRMTAKTSWSDHSFGRQTRYSGFVAREPVAVHARVVAGGLEAIELAAGTRASYLQGIEDSIGTAWWLGVLFASIGGLLIVVALALLVMAVRKA
jgi:hypothetical protein